MTLKQADLANVISEVIANLAMMVVEPPQQEVPFAPQLHGSIDFTGPVNGTLAIYCEEPLALALAANLLGTENSDAQTQANAWDALAELLNVICGNLVTVFFDSEKPFALSVPQVRVILPGESIDIDITGDTGNRRTTRLLLDEQPAVFVLTTDEPA